MSAPSSPAEASGTTASGGSDARRARSSACVSLSAGGFDERLRSALGSTMGGGLEVGTCTAPAVGERSLISRITASSRDDGAPSADVADAGEGEGEGEGGGGSLGWSSSKPAGGGGDDRARGGGGEEYGRGGDGEGDDDR